MGKPKLKPRGRGTFPWEYDAIKEVASRAERIKRSRKRYKQMSKLEKQLERTRHDRQRDSLDKGTPKMIRPWPQGWRVPTSKLPLSAKEYARYLETPHWQEFRDIYHASNLLQECYVCGNPEFELHHHTYIRIGNEGLNDVIPLCSVHHRAVHKAVKAGVQLSGAHSWVKARFQSGNLDMKVTKLEN